MYDLISSCLFNKCCVKSEAHITRIRIVDLMKMKTHFRNMRVIFHMYP